MCASQDTHSLTFAVRTGLTKNKHVPGCSFLFGRTSTKKSSKLPKYPEDEAIIGPLAHIHMVLQLQVSVKPLLSGFHLNVERYLV